MLNGEANSDGGFGCGDGLDDDGCLDLTSLTPSLGGLVVAVVSGDKHTSLTDLVPELLDVHGIDNIIGEVVQVGVARRGTSVYPSRYDAYLSWLHRTVDQHR